MIKKLFMLRVSLLMLFLVKVIFTQGQNNSDTTHKPVFKQLDEIEVKARENQTYLQPVSASGTKTKSAVLEVPQTISSVSRQLMDDKMEFSMKDAIGNIAGINSYSGYNEFTIRGFRAENAHNINGLRGYNTKFTSALLLNVESIDVIKGPVAALSGNGDPGGNIDLVTKKPLPALHAEIDVFGGTWNHFRAQGDVTGPMNKSKSLLYRLNTGYDQTKSFRDEFFSKAYQVAPSFSFVPNDRIQLNFDFSLSHINTILDRGQPGLENSTDLKSTPISLSLSQPGDYLNETDVASIISFNWKINSHISFHSGYLNYITSQQVAEHGLKNYITEDSVDLYFQKWKFNTVTHSLSNYFNFKFNTGVLKHDLLAGYDYIRSGVMLDQSHYELPDMFGAGSGIVGTFNLLNPVYVPHSVGKYKLSHTGEEGLDANQYHTHGVYIQDQIFYKKFQLLLGLRKELYRTLGNGDSGSLRTIQNVWSPRAGLVYKILPALNVYAIYTRGFDPYEASTSVQVFNAPFKPIQSELMEIGLKAGLLKNKLYTTLSLYQLSLYNVAVNANDPNNPDLYVQRGKDQARGLELEVNGNILSNLSIHLSYAYNIAKIKKSDVHAEIGTVKENAPRNCSNSFFKYHFKKGLLKKISVMGGYIQIGKRNTLDPLIQLPGYVTAMAGASYDFDQFSIALNVNNIMNEKYWIGAYNNVNKWPGSSRNFLIKINWRLSHAEKN